MNKVPVIEVDLTDYKIQGRISYKERHALPPKNFLFPATRSYPITSPDSIRKAIHDYGRGKNNLTYEEFIHKLWKKAKELGYESGMPDSTKKKYNLK